MFQGFNEKTIEFLKGLEENNNKIWFDENKTNYQSYLQENFKELVMDLIPYMLEIDPLFEVNPKKCISRIYRDVRFSRDKSPYRANMWLSFKRLYPDWKMEPTYFFEIFPDYYRFGMGFYNIPKETMDKLRELILENNKEFNKIHTIYKKQKTFKIEGDVYKRTLNEAVSEELKDWYQRKEIYFVCNRGIDDALMNRNLIEDIVEGFDALSPIYRFFLKLRDK